MQAKRVVAKNMRAALQIISEELGPDTIILSNKKVPEGIELICSMDSAHLDDSRLVKRRAERAANEVAELQGTAVQNSVSESKSVPKTVSPISPLAKELEAMQSEAKRKARQIRARLQRKSAPEQAQVMKSEASSISDVDLPQAFSQPQSQGQSFKARIEDISQADHSAKVMQESPSSLKLDQDIVETENVRKLVQSAVSRHMAEEGKVAASTSNANDQVLSSLKSELNAMRQLIQHQMGSAAWSSFNDNNPQQALIWRRLNQLGISSAVMRELLASLDVDLSAEEAWFKVLTEFGRRIAVWNHDIVEQGGVHAFVGPTGVGKTTTIGKLAVQHVLKHGNESLALVTIDTHRIAANEQLRTFGRILDVPVKVLDKAEDLGLVLHGLRKKSLILIDTAGLSAGDPRLEKQLETLNQLKAKVNTHIVLSTTAQQSVIERAYENYKACGLKSCVLSKLDETASLGGALSMVIQQNLPLSYFTNGQKIPEDISVAKGSTLVAAAVKLGRDVSLDEEVMADQFAQAWPEEAMSA